MYIKHTVFILQTPFPYSIVSLYFVIKTVVWDWNGTCFTFVLQNLSFFVLLSIIRSTFYNWMLKLMFSYCLESEQNPVHILGFYEDSQGKKQVSFN